MRPVRERGMQMGGDSMSSESGRTQLLRLLRLMRTLQGQTYPGVQQLADSLQVTRRTIYRDLEVLQSAGLPVHFDAERKGYSLPATLNLGSVPGSGKPPPRSRPLQP